MSMPSRYACATCGATDRVVHRTSPKGEPFAGKCADCLGGRSAATPAGKLTEALAPEPWLENADSVPPAGTACPNCDGIGPESCPQCSRTAGTEGDRG